MLEADGGKITLTASHPALAQRLFLMNQTGKPQKVTLAVSDLRSSAGKPVRLDLTTPGPLSLTPYQAQTVELKGTFAEVGELTGLLTLQIEGSAQPQQYTLVVKREKGAQQIDVDAQSDPPAYRWPWGTTTSVRLQLAETTGEVAAFQLPKLQNLLVNVSDTYKSGASYTRTRLFLPPGSGALATNPPTLPPWGSLGLRMQIEGLHGTGKYEGTVRVATPNGPQTKPFILFIKDFWLYAALVILAGVWASYWLRRWFAVGRPQALAEYQIGIVLQRVQIAIPDVTSAVRQALETALQDLHRATLLDPGTDIKADLQTANDQLENYLAIEAVLALRSQLGDLVPDKDQRDIIMVRLNALDQSVQDGKLRALTNEAGKNALVAEATSLRGDLVAGAGKALENAVAALTANVLAERAALGAGTLPAADKTSLAARLDDANAHLATATRKLADSRAAAGQAATDLLQQGWQEYEAASTSYLAAAVGRFRSELAEQTQPPVGIEATAWQSLQKELLAALPANATAAQYADARRHYLDAVLGGLEKQAGEDARTAGGDPAAAADLKAVAQAAAAAREKLKGGGEVTAAEVEKLRADYQSAMARLTPARQQAFARGDAAQIAEAAGGRPGAPQVGGDPASLVDTPQLPRAIGSIRAPMDIIADVQRHDRIVAWIVSAVSVLVGLRVLWAATPAFGSLIDYIGAFLWGFGLHELNKITMPDGLAKLGLVFPQIKSGG
ncbi:MAG TPA: hypothetical protein VGH73_04410 [Thermoanaerobaculia bacterium]